MPAILPIAIGMAGVGILLSAKGKQEQGIAESNAYKYNARISESDALAATQKAEYDADLQQRDVRRLLGEQRTRYAKAGVDISSGSPLLIMAATAAEGQEEKNRILYEGAVESTRFKNQANMQRYYAKQAKRAGTIGALSSLFSGAGSMMGSLSGGGGVSAGGSSVGGGYSAGGSSLSGSTSLR